MKTLKESILADMDDVLQSGDDESMKIHILNQLHNKNLYFYNEFLTDTQAFRINKKNGKWIVDLKTSITCYGTENGYVTDGTFSFGVAAKNFTIMPENKNKDCNIKSLKYGPTLVNGIYIIYELPKLKNLNYCPNKIMGDVTIINTGIDTLKYFPEYCQFFELVDNKKLKSLDDICKITIKDGFRIYKNGFKSTQEQIFNNKNINVLNNNPIYILDTPITMPAPVFKINSKK